MYDQDGEQEDADDDEIGGWDWVGRVILSGRVGVGDRRPWGNRSG